MNTFDEKTHSYFIDGKRATGVTTIIGVLAKPQLIGWAARMAVEFVEEMYLEGVDIADEKILLSIAPSHLKTTLEEARTAHTKKKEAAGTHGTDAHALVESYVKHCLEQTNGYPAPRKEPSAIDPFITWAQQNVDKFLFSERRMFNKELFIAGTADFGFVGKDGKKYMGDFKTSSGVYGIDYWLQVAGYRLLAEPEEYDGSCVVRLGKDGGFEVLYRFDYKTDREAFLACLILYRAQATYKPKK